MKVRPGVISVVLVNYRGVADTLEAIRALGEVNWPSDLLEIVVVDNNSGDDSVDRLRSEAPHVKLVVSESNDGFAGGCNLGVQRSSGEFIAFLNNDARPDEQWISAAIARFDADDSVKAVASTVLSWDGTKVDYIDAAMTWFGMGYKPFTGEPLPRLSDEPHDVLFGTGSAMFVRRDAFEALGGFDESYFMFFEDVDFGWRLNLRGWRFVYEPSSVAYHKHHASMGSFGSHGETYLLERNALFTLYKNLSEASLREVLPGALSLSVRRGVTRAGIDSTQFDLRRTPGKESEIAVSTQLVASAFAIDQFVENLPHLEKSRAAVQSTRAVSDAMIWRLSGNVDAAVIQEKYFVEGYENLVEAFDVLTPHDAPRVAVITGDPLGARLAGPAIRAWNIALALSQSHEVTLVSLTVVEDFEAPFHVTHIAAGDERSFANLAKWADVIVFQGHAIAVSAALRNSDAVMVVDLYDPMHLEQLEQGRQLPALQWSANVQDAVHVLNEQIARGDFFVCASERQRLMWLGHLGALGRLNPENYLGDPEFRHLIDVVPFGLSSSRPVHNRDVLKGIVDGIGVDDKLLLWGGGLYNWFDPQTLIKAVATLHTKRSGVKLFFQGTKHPHPGVPEMEIVKESRELARDLGVLNSAVFFNESWVDFDDRQNYLLEADAGVSTHHQHIETTFAFRTRILDYLWASLPMVVTDGDSFAELVERERLGVVVPAGDSDALADALEKVLFDEDFREVAIANIERVRKDFFWEETLSPLVRFVASAARARDQSLSLKRQPRPKRRRSGLRHDVSRTLFYLRTGGIGAAARKIVQRLKAKM